MSPSLGLNVSRAEENYFYMKIKRQKKVKRSLSVLTNSFGFRKPFQVIVDGNFIHVMRMSDRKIEEIESVLGPVRLSIILLTSDHLLCIC